MSAADRLARLLALVPWLLAHPGVTMRECAQHFGVTEKELEDDLYLLIVSGDGVLGADDLVDIQFWSEDDDDDSDARFDATIRVVRAQALDRPMRLNASEAMALLVALRMLEQLPGVADRQAIASAVAKLEGATSPSTVPPGAGEIAIDVAVDADVRAVVDEALADGSELDLRYASATNGAITDRRVVPYGVVAVDGVAYLDAFCRFAGARRTFRLDRVLAAEAVAPDTPPSADDAGEAGSGRGLSTPSRSAVLDLDAASRWVAEAHGAEVVAERDGGGARVRLPLHDLEWAVRLVLAQAGGVRVVEPAELAEAVADAARGLSRRTLSLYGERRGAAAPGWELDMRMPQGAEWLILLLIVVLLFGAKRLPDAARGLGRSLRIFKAETKGMADDDAATPAPVPPAPTAPAAAAAPTPPAVEPTQTPVPPAPGAPAPAPVERADG